jgi:hypothetical protein
MGFPLVAIPKLDATARLAVDWRISAGDGLAACQCGTDAVLALLLGGWWPPVSAGSVPNGGDCRLVPAPVFKTGVSSDPAQAGSIPVRLR